MDFENVAASGGLLGGGPFDKLKERGTGGRVVRREGADWCAP